MPLAYADVNPFVYATPCSPNFAAAAAGPEVDMAVIIDACRKLQDRADIVVVEGVGGWRAPLSNDYFAGDIARALNAPVIFVVGMRLGCINHTLLSMEAIERDGIPLKGWVANFPDPGYITATETTAYLQSRIAAPLLGAIPWINNHSVSGGEGREYLDVNAVL